MADWPSIKTVNRDMFRQYKQRGQIRTEFENGVVQSRATATSSRWIFILGWRVLSNTHYNTLCTFFDSNLGGTFNWTHPGTTTVHVVRFSGDRLPDAIPSGNISGAMGWQLTGLQLEEA